MIKRKRIKISQIEDKLQSFTNEIAIIESLSRVQLEAMRNGENLKDCDTENISIVLCNHIEKLHKSLSSFERFCIFNLN